MKITEMNNKIYHLHSIGLILAFSFLIVAVVTKFLESDVFGLASQVIFRVGFSILMSIPVIRIMMMMAFYAKRRRWGFVVLSVFALLGMASAVFVKLI